MIHRHSDDEHDDPERDPDEDDSIGDGGEDADHEADQDDEQADEPRRDPESVRRGRFSILKWRSRLPWHGVPRDSAPPPPHYDAEDPVPYMLFIRDVPLNDGTLVRLHVAVNLIDHRAVGVGESSDVALNQMRLATNYLHGRHAGSD